jgi:hypothetical protein
MDGQRMRKLLAALVVGAGALGSALVLAQAPATRPIASEGDAMPLSKMDTEQAKTARAAAKAKWDKMTPEEKAAVKKAAAKKKREELTPMEAVATESTYAYRGDGKPLVGDFWTTRERDMLRPSTSTPATQEQKTKPTEQR